MSCTSLETSAVSKCAVPDRSPNVAFSARLSGSAAPAWAAWGSCRMPALSVVVREVCGLAERWVRLKVAAWSAGQEKRVIRCAILHIRAGYASLRAWTCARTHQCRQPEGLSMQRTVSLTGHNMRGAATLSHAKHLCWQPLCHSRHARAEAQSLRGAATPTMPAKTPDK